MNCRPTVSPNNYRLPEMHNHVNLDNIGCYLYDLDHEWEYYSLKYGDSPGVYLHVHLPSVH
jgi:hypothetical protein